MKKSILNISLAAICVAVLAGCAAPAQNSNVYVSRESGRVQDVQNGTVVSTRYVQISEGANGVGLVSGAVVGGALASNFGKGNGRTAMTILGAIAGGAVGQEVERKNSQINGLELTVRLDNGRTIAIVQPDNGTGFYSGQRVRLVGNGNNARVSPY